uniref:RING-H2 finger protein ATL2J n=1 Tax=Suaeda glauca TaxID=397272 RepID=V5Q0U5_9CARY|nr:RING-H2 finger protein ATL2J [Suaeda glauca]
MMSSISFIIMLLIMLIIPTILYTFFFLINCPSNPFNFLRRNHDVDNVNNARRSKISNEEDDEDNSSNKDKNSIELVATSNETLGKDVECPICLSIFVQGEELKQLKICKHMFHTSCIDKWLSTHCNCPVCRGFVGNHAKHMKEKEVNNRVLVSRDVDRHDLWQGLPDSAGLV